MYDKEIFQNLKRMNMEMIFKIPANSVKDLVSKKKYVFQKSSSKVNIENVNERLPAVF